MVLFAHADRLARRILAKYICLRAAKEKQMTSVSNRVTLWPTSYSACVVHVYTKTIILLSVGESGGYLPPLCE